MVTYNLAYWLDGKLIILPNDSDVNEISHSSKKSNEANAWRKKFSTRINLSLRTPFSAVRLTGF